MQVTINNADFKDVQRFFWDLNSFSTLRNFDFNPDTAISSSPRGKIGVNRAEANLTIVKATIKYLRGEPNTKSDVIGKYLVHWFPQHLQFLREMLDCVGSNDKAFIGKAIYDIFDDVQILKRHWDVCGDVTWYEVSADLSTLLDWLNDPSALRDLSRKDKEWLRDVKASSNPGRKLFTPLTQMVAELWLRGPEKRKYCGFRWIEEFLSPVSIPRYSCSMFFSASN